MIKPIEILTPNLLDCAALFTFSGAEFCPKQGSPNNVSGGFRAEFPSPIEATCVLVKDTSAEQLEISCKTSAEQADFTPFSAFTLTKIGRDMLICFNAPLTACSFCFSFGGAGEDFSFKNFILARRLILLEKALSSFLPSGYFKGGHHYTADGGLIVWREFFKNSGSLVLDNLAEETKLALSRFCGENIFLTFIFYGTYDLSQSGEYALTAPLKAELNRLSALWSLSLEITER